MTAQPVRIALIGMGRMGRALDALAGERGCVVVARLDADDLRDGLNREQLSDAQVAIEFTEPHAAVANAVACLRVGCRAVIGTTGWSNQMDTLTKAVAETQVAALWSPNFSIGVQLFLAIAQDAAKRLRKVHGFETIVIETHHSAKKDAPSGTGLAIAQRLNRELGVDVAISSVRVGSVPGTHEVVMDAPFEQIRLVHEARDRRVFADGALTAARWLSAATHPAVFTMQDVIASGDAGA